jgi:hypothetical protein
MYTKFWPEILKRKDNLVDLGVDERIILKWTLNKQNKCVCGVSLVCGLESTGSEWGLVAGSCEHGNEPSGFIKERNFLTG